MYRKQTFWELLHGCPYRQSSGTQLQPRTGAKRTIHDAKTTRCTHSKEGHGPPAIKTHGFIGVCACRDTFLMVFGIMFKFAACCVNPTACDCCLSRNLVVPFLYHIKPTIRIYMLLIVFCLPRHSFGRVGIMFKPAKHNIT